MTITMLSSESTQPAEITKDFSSSRKLMDTAVSAVYAHKDEWVATGIHKRIAIIETLIKDVARIAERWATRCCEAKGSCINNSAAIEEWLGGPYLILCNLRSLRQSLLDIEKSGYPQIPGPITVRSNGQVVAQVFPQNIYDHLLYFGISAEVWMQPGVTIEELAQTQATIYQNKNHKGKVALVLGAGNFSCLGPTDFLYKLFVEDQVVVYKTNPVNDYLDHLVEQGFRALIERGFLRVVPGGVAEGTYLAHHPDIEEIHLTGSDKTFEAIVFGSGTEGAKRKAEREARAQRDPRTALPSPTPIVRFIKINERPVPVRF